jgi:protein gp37
MSTNSKIEWTDHTFNPWIGCTKISPGCVNCYADAQDKFRKWTPEGWGEGKPRKRTSAANWKEPLRWNQNAHVCDLCGEHYPVPVECMCDGQRNPTRRTRVFCASLADWLDDEVPIEWLADLLEIIHATPNLDWLLLTKRPENWKERIMAVAGCRSLPGNHQGGGGDLGGVGGGTVPANVWIGTTVEDQTRAEQRIPALLAIPARVRFLSCEPLLGPVGLAYTCFNGSDSYGTMPGIHWVIAGGESGHHARPMHPSWARSLRDECAAVGVAFFFKQWGSLAPLSTTSGHQELPWGDYILPANGDEGFGFIRKGKGADRRLDGREHNEFPA